MFFRFGFVLLFIFTLSACEQRADLSNPDYYSKNGVSFSLPGNWNVSEDIQEAEGRI